MSNIQHILESLRIYQEELNKLLEENPMPDRKRVFWARHDQLKEKIQVRKAQIIGFGQGHLYEVNGYFEVNGTKQEFYIDYNSAFEVPIPDLQFIIEIKLKNLVPNLTLFHITNIAYRRLGAFLFS